MPQGDFLPRDPQEISRKLPLSWARRFLLDFALCSQICLHLLTSYPQRHPTTQTPFVAPPRPAVHATTSARTPNVNSAHELLGSCHL